MNKLLTLCAVLMAPSVVWGQSLAGANGEQPKTLTSFHVDTSNPVWSPDGQWIAFSSKKDGTQQIYIMRKDGSGLKQITQGPGAKWYISW